MMCRGEGEDMDPIGVILGEEGGEARRVFELGEKFELNEVGDGVFVVASVWVVQKLGV